MAKFVLTAQLQLQAPNNVKQVVNQIQQQLNGVQVNVQVQNAGKAQRDLNSITKAADNASSSFNKAGKAFAASVKRFSALAIATRAVSLFTTTLSGAIKESISFERELIKISQVTGKTIAQLSSLTSTITNLSTSLGVSSTSILSVGRILSQAGLNAQDTEIALSSLAKTELAPTFDNITQTAEGAVAILNQFKTGAAALEGQLGALNAVAGQFAVESGDLISVIRRTGGVFKAAGGDLNELIALFTSVRATTRESAESIATGLRTIFTRIQRPETIKFLEQFGVRLTDLEGKFVGPYEAVRQLSAALAGLGERDLTFIEVAEELGGFRQIGKVLPLLSEFATAQEALKVAQKGQDTLAKDAAKAQLSLAVQIARVKEEFLALVRGVTETPTFQIMARSALELASALIRVADSMKPLLPIITAIAAVKFTQGIGGFLGGIAGGLKGGKGFNAGGRVHAFATGGIVPGTGNRDTVPAMLTPGEFVIKKSSVAKIGAENLATMNRGGEVQKFKKGGTAIKRGQQAGGVGIYDSDMVGAGGKALLGQITASGKPYEVIHGPAGSGKTTFAAKRFGSNFIKSAEDIDKYGRFVVISGAGEVKGGGLSPQASAIMSGATKITALAPSPDTVMSRRESRLATGAMDNRSEGQLRGTLKAPTTFNKDLYKQFRNVELLEKFADGGKVQRFAEGGGVYKSQKEVGMLVANEGDKPDSQGVFYKGNDQYIADIKVSGFTKADIFQKEEDKLKKEIDKTSVRLSKTINTPIENSVINTSKNLLSTATGKLFEGYVLASAGLEDPGNAPFDIPVSSSDLKKLTTQPVPDELVDVKRTNNDANRNSIVKKLVNTFGDKTQAKGAGVWRKVKNATPESRGRSRKKKSNQVSFDDIFGTYNNGGAVVQKFANGTTGTGAKPRNRMGMTEAQVAAAEERKRLRQQKSRGGESIQLKAGTVGGLFLQQGSGGTQGINISLQGKQLPSNFPQDVKSITGPITTSLIKPQAGEALRKQIEPNIANAVQQAASTTIQSLEIPPLDIDESSAAKKAVSKIDLTSIEGYIFEAFTSALTGLKLSEAGATFDYVNPSSRARDRISNIFSKSMPTESLIDAKRTLSSDSVQSGKSSIANKILSSIMSGALGPDKFQKFATGGVVGGGEANLQVARFAAGGNVGTDTVPALLTPGEFVVNRKSAQRIGYGKLNRMNKVGKYANGGVVQKFANGTSGSGVQSSGGGFMGFDKVTGGLIAMQGALGMLTPAIDENSSSFEKATAGFNSSLQGVIATATSVKIALEAFGVSLAGSSITKFFGRGSGSAGELLTKGFQGLSSKLSNTNIFKGIQIGRGNFGPFGSVGGSMGAKARATALAQNKGFFGSVGRGIGKASKLPGINQLVGFFGRFAAGLASATGPILAIAGIGSVVGGLIKGFRDLDGRLKEAIKAEDVATAQTLAVAQAAEQNFGGVIAGLASGLAPFIGDAGNKLLIGVSNFFGGQSLDQIKANTNAQIQQAKSAKAVEEANKATSEAMEQFRNGTASATDVLAASAAATAQLNAQFKAIGDQIAANESNKSTIGGGAILRNIGAYLGGGLFGMETAATRNKRIDKENKELQEQQTTVDKQAISAAKPGIDLLQRQFAAAGGSFEDFMAKLEKDNKGAYDAIIRQGSTELVKQFKNLSEEAARTKAAFEAMNLGMRSVQAAAGAMTTSLNNYLASQEAGNISLNQSIATLEASVTSAAAGLNSADFESAVGDALSSLQELGGDDAQIKKFEGNLRGINAAQKFFAQASEETRKQLQAEFERGAGGPGTLQERQGKVASIIGSQLEKAGIAPEVKKRIEEAIKGGKLDDGAIEEIMMGNLAPLDSLLTELGEKTLSQVIPALKQYAEAQEKLVNLTKQRISIENELISAQKRTLDVQLEAAEIIAKYGGAAVTPEQRTQNIIDKANVDAQGLGVGGLRTGSAAEIVQRQRDINKRLAQIQGIRADAARGDAGARQKLAGESGVKLANEEERLLKLNEQTYDTTKALIDQKVKEIELIKRKNQLEKSSIEALYAGDIMKFFEQKAAAGAQAAMSIGNQQLISQFDLQDMGTALMDLRSQKEAGVTQVGGRNIDDVIGSGMAGVSSLTGVSAESQRVAFDMTPEIQAVESEIRSLARTLADNFKNIENALSRDLDIQDIKVAQANNIVAQSVANVKAAGATPPAAPPAAVANNSRGGLIYASEGQYVNFKPKGTDTVPAMLTPGEFVVNARATKQHRSLLENINSGKDPQYASRGGIIGPKYLVTGGEADEEEIKRLEARRTPPLGEGRRMRDIEHLLETSRERSKATSSFTPATPTPATAAPESQAPQPPQKPSAADNTGRIRISIDDVLNSDISQIRNKPVPPTPQKPAAESSPVKGKGSVFDYLSGLKDSGAEMSENQIAMYNRLAQQQAQTGRRAKEVAAQRKEQQKRAEYFQQTGNIRRNNRDGTWYYENPLEDKIRKDNPGISDAQLESKIQEYQTKKIEQKEANKQRFFSSKQFGSPAYLSELYDWEQKNKTGSYVENNREFMRLTEARNEELFSSDPEAVAKREADFQASEARRAEKEKTPQRRAYEADVAASAERKQREKESASKTIDQLGQLGTAVQPMATSAFESVSTLFSSATSGASSLIESGKEKASSLASSAMSGLSELGKKEAAKKEAAQLAQKEKEAAQQEKERLDAIKRAKQERAEAKNKPQESQLWAATKGFASGLFDNSVTRTVGGAGQSLFGVAQTLGGGLGEVAGQATSAAGYLTGSSTLSDVGNNLVQGSRNVVQEGFGNLVGGGETIGKNTVGAITGATTYDGQFTKVGGVQLGNTVAKSLEQKRLQQADELGVGNAVRATDFVSQFAIEAAAGGVGTGLLNKTTVGKNILTSIGNTQTLKSINTIGDKAAKAVGSVAKPLIGTVSDAANYVTRPLINAASDAANYVTRPLINAASDAAGSARKALPDIIESFKTLPGDMVSGARQMYDDVAGGFRGLANLDARAALSGRLDERTADFMINRGINGPRAMGNASDVVGARPKNAQPTYSVQQQSGRGLMGSSRRGQQTFKQANEAANYNEVRDFLSSDEFGGQQRFAPQRSQIPLDERTLVKRSQLPKAAQADLDNIDKQIASLNSRRNEDAFKDLLHEQLRKRKLSMFDKEYYDYEWTSMDPKTFSRKYNKYLDYLKQKELEFIEQQKDVYRRGTMAKAKAGTLPQPEIKPPPVPKAAKASTGRIKTVDVTNDPIQAEVTKQLRRQADINRGIAAREEVLNNPNPLRIRGAESSSAPQPARSVPFTSGKYNSSLAKRGDITGIPQDELDIIAANSLDRTRTGGVRDKYVKEQLEIARKRNAQATQQASPAAGAKRSPIKGGDAQDANSGFTAQQVAQQGGRYNAPTVTPQDQLKALEQSLSDEMRAGSGPDSIIRRMILDGKIKALKAKQSQPYKSGGIVYASSGTLVPYQPRGTDTVPAMLTPGEFVVNAGAVKRGNNLQMLKAINSGSATSPAAMSRGGRVQYFENGGSVSGGSSVSNGVGLSSEAMNSFSASLENFNAKLAENITSLSNIEFKIALSPTSVNINLQGTEFLERMTTTLKQELMNYIGQQLKNFSMGSDGKLRNSGGSGLGTPL